MAAACWMRKSTALVDEDIFNDSIFDEKGSDDIETTVDDNNSSDTIWCRKLMVFC